MLTPVLRIASNHHRCIMRAVWRSFVLACLVPLAASATDFQVGDLFVGTEGAYQHYTNAGVYIEDLPTQQFGPATGCAFDPTGRLVGTLFLANQIVVMGQKDPHTIQSAFATPGLIAPDEGSNESVRFDSDGTFWVGHADGGGQLLHHYDASYTLIDEIAVAHSRGTDWVELAADHCTMFYTSEISTVFRYDVCTHTQLPDFATVPGGPLYALRLLPPGDGTGGLLVANGEQILRLDAGGAVAQTYSAPLVTNWFALNLDPNGTSFWSAAFSSPGNVTRFNINSGAIELGPLMGVTAGAAGLCLLGEPLAGTCYENSAYAKPQGPAVACQGSKVTLDGSQSHACGLKGLEYEWSRDALVVCAASPNPKCDVTADVDATYALKIVCLDNRNCTDTKTVTVKVTAGPLADLKPLGTVCSQQSLQLDATGSLANGCVGALEYQFRENTTILRPWDKAAIFGPLNPGASTTYTVDVRCAAAPGCTASASQPVTVEADQLPPDLGNGLRQVKQGGDVVQSWGGVPEAKTYSLYRATAKGLWPPPALRTLVATTVHTEPDVSPPPPLYFYRVVGVSCSGIEGP